MLHLRYHVYCYDANMLSIIIIFIFTIILIGYLLVYIDLHLIPYDTKKVLEAQHLIIHHQSFIDVYGKYMSKSEIDNRKRYIDRVYRWLNMNPFIRMIFWPNFPIDPF